MTMRSRRFEHAGRSYEARADDDELPEWVSVSIYDAEGRPCDMIYPGGVAGQFTFMVHFDRPLTASDDAVIDIVIAQAKAVFEAGTQ